MVDVAVPRPGTPDAPFWARIDRDVVVVEGPDAGTYLQSQLSQDLAGLAVGESTWTLLLQPTGKVIAWGRVCRRGDEVFELDVDAGAGADALARLARFKLRTAAELRLATRSMVAVRGVEPGAPDAVAGSPAALPLGIDWPGTTGYDLLDADGDGARAVGPNGVAEAPATALELARIAAAVPVVGHELTEATIPAEAGQWVIDSSVSFTKGCYPGQELVARVDSRGNNVPKPVRSLVIDAPAEADGVVAGAVVLDASGAAVGALTSAAFDTSTGRWLALGPVGRAVVVPTAVVVAGHPAEVVACATS